jgi:hypothetical protein
MGIFDIFKKKEEIVQPEGNEADQLKNYPEVLSAKLLFINKPDVNAEAILDEAKLYFKNIVGPGEGEPLLFSFPYIRIELADANIPAQCLAAIPDEKHPGIDLPETALQQNWHWSEANELVKDCKYELLVTDFMTCTLEYKQRVNLFMNFLVAVIKATSPNLVYSVSGQKLLAPTKLISIWDSEEREELYGICNVRLYNIGDTPGKEMLMDTVGLSIIGLPDFQIRFSNFDVNDIANLLWNYAYYIYEYGDVIKDGNTMEGITTGSKWRCERLISQLQPERMVINVQPL